MPTIEKNNMKRHPNGTWSSLEFTLAEAQRVMEEHHCETLHSNRKLAELGYSSLGHAIVDYHGGFSHFRKLLGEELPRRENGVWKNVEYTVAEARKVMKENRCKTLPSGNRLRELGYSCLATAIVRHHGGFHHFRRLLGEELPRRENGVWKNVEYTVAEARKVMKEHQCRTLPSIDRLGELGYSCLVHAISDYHGGFHHFRKLLGEELPRREMGIWKNVEYTVAEARKVMKENRCKTLPSRDRLAELGYSSLAIAIILHHGGFHHFRRLLGEELPRRENGVWKNVEYTVAEAREVMEKHGFRTLPSDHKLGQLGYSNLANAINRYHHGFTAFRLKLGEYDQALAVVRKLVEETV